MIGGRPVVRSSQRLFGEIVYWTTVLCAILCIVGPVVTFVSFDNNILNPSTLYGNIFEGMPTESGIALEEDVSSGASSLKVKKVSAFETGQTITIKNDVDLETRVISAIDEDANIIYLTEPVNYSYSVSDESVVAEQTVWDNAKDNVKGGHYWLSHLTTGDGFTLFALVLGCSVGIIAMTITAVFLIIKERAWGWATGALFIAFISGISMVGLVSMH
ncbi:MAG: hypothetical protein R6U89_04260 [Dehalococcoidia bacterium]